MPFSPNIPQATDDPSASQPLLLQNFGTIYTDFNVNHTELGGGDPGKHKFVQMPQQASAPATAADEGALYTKDVAGSAQLFWREESSGTEYQMTGQSTAVGTQQDIVLPGGYTIKSGTVTLSGLSVVVAFTTPFSTIYAAVATPQSTLGPRELRIFNKSVNNIQFNTNSGTTFTVNWIAIGLT